MVLEVSTVASKQEGSRFPERFVWRLHILPGFSPGTPALSKDADVRLTEETKLAHVIL